MVFESGKEKKISWILLYSIHISYSLNISCTVPRVQEDVYLSRWNSAKMGSMLLQEFTQQKREPSSTLTEITLNPVQPILALLAVLYYREGSWWSAMLCKVGLYHSQVRIHNFEGNWPAPV